MAADESSSAERHDGREASTMRQLKVDLACLSRADGSASWKQEGTEVLAAVFGPTEAPGRRENPERAVVEVLYRPRAGLADQTEKEYEHVVRRTVETVLLHSLHPRTVVQIVLQVVSDDGSVLAAALNAAGAALINSGIPMAGFFSSVTCAVLSDSLLVDPTREEEQAASAIVCVALENPPVGAPSGDFLDVTPIITSYTKGAVSESAFFAVVDFCRKGQKIIDQFARRSFKEYLVHEGLEVT